MSFVAARSAPIVDVVVPGTGIVRDALLIGAGTALTAICAQVYIPVEPVPFTLQTMSVMLCGLALGARRGFLAQAFYVGIGACGAPIFALHKFGLPTLTGTTGGYLVSFFVVAALLGWLAERGWTRSVWKTAAAMAIGITINLGMGALWLSHFIGFKAAFLSGVAPFLIPEAMKASVVILALPAAWKLTGVNRRS